MQNSILIVEDDLDINNLLKDVLINDYAIYQSYTGSNALNTFKQQNISLILLDLMLPDIDGDDLISLFKQHKNVPIIVLTAKAEIDVLVKVLELGADDYISKPFNTKEVIARIQKQLKQTTPLRVFTIGELTLDETTREVTYANTPIVLTSKEFEILKLFMSYPQKVFTKANIYETIWHDTYYGDDNTITVHMSRLRTKLSQFSNEELIETIWGVGFKLKS